MEEVRRSGTETYVKNGLRFTQYMDLDTDMAFYQDMDGNLLMKVDSSGRTYNAQDEQIGTFEMMYPDSNWKFVPEKGAEIVHRSWNLFEVVEPFVVGELFGKKVGL